MIKYEIREASFEEAFSGEMPALSPQDVYDIWDHKSATEDTLVDSYNTLEAAQTDLERVYKKWPRTSIQRGCGPKYISANIILLVRMEYDDDGNLDQGDLIEFAAEPYSPNEDSHQ